MCNTTVSYDIRQCVICRWLSVRVANRERKGLHLKIKREREREGEREKKIDCV